MTMEDIALNIYVPSDTEEENKKIEKNVKKTKVVKSSKKNTDIIHIHESPVIESKKSTKNEKAHEKHPQVSKRVSDESHYPVKKKKKIDNDKNENKKHKVKVTQNNNDILNIATNDNVEPINEPLFSGKTFQSLESLHPHLVANLSQLFNITTMTVVQQITIPVLLSRKDALIRSQTGSGKTLAYAVPIMNFLQDVKPKISRSDGVKALIVLPTRELALQTYECFQKLVRAFTWLVPGLLVGGEKRKSEKARLRKGINILIGTPGRLLDHANKTSALSLQNVQWLILDEADKLLDLGYEEAIGSILEILKEQKKDDEEEEKSVQTVLLSATLTPGVERLAGLALNNPVRLDASESSDNNLVNSDENSPYVIPQSLDQKYIIVPAKLRLVLLASIIIHHSQLEKKDKLLIFMATQDMVNFYTDLLSSLPLKKVVLFKLHGNMTQIERTEVFKKFRTAESGVLLCTDVGARGLDLPKTDIIIQYNAPSTPTDYVHRVGRTARIGSNGVSVLFLDPAEMNFKHWLNEKRIKLSEENMETYFEGLLDVDFDQKKFQRLNRNLDETVSALQLKLENALLDDKELHEIGCQAYKSWVRFYASYPKESRTIFCFKQLHLGHHAKSFALRDPPSKIGGIGKPSYIHKKDNNNKAMKKKKMKVERLKVPTMSDRTKRLITSEFDSGINFKRKKK